MGLNPFLKIGFVVAVGRFYSYDNEQLNQIKKECKKKKSVLYIQKIFDEIF